MFKCVKAQGSLSVYRDGHVVARCVGAGEKDVAKKDWMVDFVAPMALGDLKEMVKAVDKAEHDGKAECEQAI